MAIKPKMMEPAVASFALQPPDWPATIDGMDALERAGTEAYSRLVLTRHRKREADAEVAAKVVVRDGLVQRAKAGEVVSGLEIAEVEAAIRAAESNAALLGEAIPCIEAEIEAADEAIRKKSVEPLDALYEQARQYHEAARQEAEAASKRANDAYHIMQQFTPIHRDWVNAHLRYAECMQRYAPAAHARQEEAKERKRKEAEANRPKPAPRRPMSDMMYPNFGF